MNVRALAAETIGTAFLLAAVVGSGIMAERLSGTNAAVALLCNTLATGAALFVLIEIFGPVSGAHFNPAVSVALALDRKVRWPTAAAYIPAQILGGILGVYIAHLMFEQPVFQISLHVRPGPSQWLSEFVATFGLIGTIWGTQRFRPATTPIAVALYIVAAYWFTASTSFANPAVTIARSLSNTFAGIAPRSTPGFVVAQFLGAVFAVPIFGWLLRSSAK